MMRLSIIRLLINAAIVCIVIACSAPAFGEGLYENYRIVVIDVKSQKDHFIASQIGRSLACWPGPGPSEFLVAPDAMDALEASEIPFVVLVENAQRQIDEEAERNRIARAERGGDFFAAYRTNAEIDSYLDELVTLPGLPEGTVTRFPIGQSIEGRVVHALRISAPPEPGALPKPTCLITAGQHAREWIGVSSGMYIADRLVRGYGVNSQITDFVDNIEFIIVPVVNPDGYHHTFPIDLGGGGDRYWRKNRRPNGTSFGVDTNRNWGFQWGGAGASSNPASDIYRGAGPFSEPETQNVRNLVEGTAGLPGLPNLKAFIDIHTYSELVLGPWGYTGAAPARSAEINPLTDAQITAMNAVDNQFFTGGPASTTLYFASGIAPDWGLGARNALSWTYELRPLSPAGLGGFSIPAAQIPVSGAEAFAGIAVVAQHIQNRLKITLVSATNPLPLIGGGLITVDVAALNAYVLDTASPRLFWRIGASGDFTQEQMNPIAPIGRYSTALVSPPCGESLQYYIQAQATDGGFAYFPASAPDALLSSSGAACPDCLGDADGNRVIDFVDISAILSNWGNQGAAGPPMNIGDSNYDGQVNFDDLNTTLTNWGLECP